MRVLLLLFSLLRLAESSKSSCEYGQRVLSEVLMRSSDDMMKSVENICEERDTSISPDATTFLNHICKHIDVLRDEEVKEQQVPKKKRGEAKANTIVKWWDQATWTEKKWKAHNKRKEELCGLDEEVERIDAKACAPS